MAQKKFSDLDDGGALASGDLLALARGGSSYRHTVGPALADISEADSLDEILLDLWGGTSGGSANAQTLTVSPGPAALVTGMRIWFTAGATNTAAATLNLNAIGATTVKQASGADLTAGMITSGRTYQVIYTGTNWVLVGGSTQYEEGTWTPALALSTPGTSTWSQTNTGTYTKVGNRVLFDASIAASLTSLGTGSGNLQITGLPVIAAGDGVASVNIASGGQYIAWGSGPGTALSVRIVTANSYMLLYNLKSGTASTVITATNITTSQTLGIYISGQYRI